MHALMTIMQEGDNFVAASELYGGTFTQLKYSFKQLGIEARFFNASSPGEIEALVDANTKAIYIETISNPSGTVPDFAKIKAIATKHTLPLICDNT